jgi:hypothetical protein
MKRCVTVWKVQTTSCSASRESKKETWMKSLKRRFMYANGLRYHNRGSERLKMLLCWRLWINFSWCRKAIWTRFLRSGHSKTRFGRSRGSEILSRRMTLRIDNLPSGRLKKRFWISWLSDASLCRKGIRRKFLHHKHWEIWLGWSRLSYVSSMRMAQRTHNDFWTS